MLRQGYENQIRQKLYGVRTALILQTCHDQKVISLDQDFVILDFYFSYRGSYCYHSGSNSACLD